MDDLPTEIVAHVGRLAGREGLPAFRLTGRLAKNATALHFAKICFNSFDISVAPDSLHKLALKASHSKFGPQIQHVTFNLLGTENMTPALFASSWSVFKAFAERGQKVTIQVKVNAIAIHDSAFIETNIHRFMIQVMRANSLKAFVEGPIILDLPSPPKNSHDAPLRSLLLHNLAVSSNTEDINISYSDVSPTAGLNYNTTTKTLLIEGLIWRSEATGQAPQIHWSFATETRAGSNTDEVWSQDRQSKSRRSPIRPREQIQDGLPERYIYNICRVKKIRKRKTPRTNSVYKPQDLRYLLAMRQIPYSGYLYAQIVSFLGAFQTSSFSLGHTISTGRVPVDIGPSCKR
ncbi:hypothetical protein KCU61_g4895, partial [Aureobasidium melanogenum]